MLHTRNGQLADEINSVEPLLLDEGSLDLCLGLGHKVHAAGVSLFQHLLALVWLVK